LVNIFYAMIRIMQLAIFVLGNGINGEISTN